MKCYHCRYYDMATGICDMNDVKIPDPLTDADCEFLEDIKTVFQQITTSSEVLAKELVYMVEYVSGFITVRKWTSNLIESEYENFEEAFSVTVEKLNEVANES